MTEAEKQSARDTLERMLSKPDVRVHRVKPLRETKNYEADPMRGESQDSQTRYLIVAIGPVPDDQREQKAYGLLGEFLPG